jgi:hypothetical protein
LLHTAIVSIAAPAHTSRAIGRRRIRVRGGRGRSALNHHG